MKWEECRILDQEENSTKRKALESIHIKKNEQSVINRNSGNLDQIWDRSIKECSKKRKDSKVGQKFGHKRPKYNLGRVT